MTRRASSQQAELLEFPHVPNIMTQDSIIQQTELQEPPQVPNIMDQTIPVEIVFTESVTKHRQIHMLQAVQLPAANDDLALPLRVSPCDNKTYSRCPQLCLAGQARTGITCGSCGHSSLIEQS